jgi:hypothetical protein
MSGGAGDLTLGGIDKGAEPARTTKVQVGYPDCDWVTADDINDPGMMAAWEPPNKSHPSGLIQLDRTHPVICGQIDYWQAQYPRALSDEVERIVKAAYEDVAISKVSHLHSLTGPVISEERRDEMLQNPSLTAALVGLLGEDALITPRLGGLGSKRKKSEDLTEDAASEVGVEVEVV